jgi:hypothetical protein
MESPPSFFLARSGIIAQIVLHMTETALKAGKSSNFVHNYGTCANSFAVLRFSPICVTLNHQTFATERGYVPHGQ